MLPSRRAIEVLFSRINVEGFLTVSDIKYLEQIYLSWSNLANQDIIGVGENSPEALKQMMIAASRAYVAGRQDGDSKRWGDKFQGYEEGIQLAAYNRCELCGLGAVERAEDGEFRCPNNHRWGEQNETNTPT